MKSRGYSSPLREAQARSTRLAIVQAASRLFGERGYAAASIDDIAREAGVARATVFASAGGKPALLKLAFDLAVGGDDEPIALPDRPRSREVIADPDPFRHAAGYAEIVTEIAGRLARLYEAARTAASTDAEAAKLWQWMLEQRAMGARNFVRQSKSKAPLRKGLDQETAADIVFALTDPALYRTLVFDRRWSVDKYRDFLTRSLQQQLLAPPAHAAT